MNAKHKLAKIRNYVKNNPAEVISLTGTVLCVVSVGVIFKKWRRDADLLNYLNKTEWRFEECPEFVDLLKDPTGRFHVFLLGKKMGYHINPESH